MVEWYSFACKYNVFCIHSSVNGHWSCFHVLAVVNSAAVNVEVHVSFWIMVLSGCMLRNIHVMCIDLCIISGHSCFWQCTTTTGRIFPKFVTVLRSLSHVRLFATSWTAACQAPLSFTISRSLLKFMCIESVMPSNHLILCRPFFCLQSFPASGSFPMSWLFASGGQGIGASASVLPVNIQGWFPVGLTSFPQSM